MAQIRVLEEDQVFPSQRYRERNASSTWKDFGFIKPIIYKPFEINSRGFWKAKGIGGL